MRSVKLLVAMAAIAALVAGPVLAQDAGMGAPSTTDGASSTTGKTTTGKKHGKKHGGKKHKKSTSGTSSSGASPATTGQ
jgi:hypothetical protein